MGRVVAGTGSSVPRHLIDRIEAVSLDGRPLGILGDLRDLLRLDAMLYARIVERTDGWALESFEADGVANPTKIRRALNEYFETSVPVPWLDFRDVPADARNVAVDVTASIGLARYTSSDFYKKVIAPSELADHRPVRVLVCEGADVVAWLGGYCAKPVSADQLAMLTTVAGPLRERIRIERLLGSAPRIHAALEATLQQIGAPALIIDARERIHEMNRAARELLTTKRDDVFSSIAAVRAKKPAALPFTLTRVSAAGHPEQFLAVLRPRSAEARMSLSVTLAANRWKLTPRQAEVLRLLVRGDSNAQIAKALGVSHRATELHVTAIFDRVGVESRSQLVAAVLLG